MKVCTFLRYFAFFLLSIFSFTMQGCRYCSSFPEDNVDIPGVRTKRNTISFCFYRGGYYGEALTIFDYCGLGWLARLLKQPQFGGLCVRSLCENDTLKHDVCVTTRIGAQIAIQYSEKDIKMWSNLSSNSNPEWRTISKQEIDLEMYSLLISIALMETFNSFLKLDNQTKMLYLRAKRMTCEYFMIDLAKFDELILENRERYNLALNDVKLDVCSKSYRILISPEQQTSFAKLISIDLKKKFNSSFPYHKCSYLFWDSVYFPDNTKN